MLHRFKIDGNIVDAVYDYITIVSEIDEQRKFENKRISQEITLSQKVDYDLIFNQNYNHLFTCELEYFDTITNSWILEIEGTFKKTDCGIDEERQIIVVTPLFRTLIDKMRELSDKEIDISLTDLETKEVRYTETGVLQLYNYGNTIMNIGIGLQKEDFATDVVSDYIKLENTWNWTTYEPSNSNETQLAGSLYIPESSGIYHGLYRYQSFVDGAEQIYTYVNELNNDIVIQISSQGFVASLFSGAQTTIADANTPQIFELKDFTFDVSGTTIYVYAIRPCFRVLTNKLTINSIENQVIEDDLNALTRYKYIYKDFSLHNRIHVSEERQQTVGEYGQIPIEYDNAGEYYLPPNFTGNFIPIFQSDWREFSIWLDKTTAVTDLINDASRTISLKAAYDVSEIINYGINSIDSRLSHDYNLCEVFKQGTINEMPMNGNLRFFVIPQSNLVLNTGINPLQELKIKLNELIDAVCDSLNAGYDINDNNELIFEHVEFFENGNSYVGENIGVDTTTIVNERNGQSYAFRTKNYTHKIDNTAKSFTINGSSELFPFQSQTLDFNDEYVEDKTRTTSIPYLTNITEIIIENERVKGWVLVAAEEFSGNSYIVPNVTFNFDGKEYKGVNGFLMPLWKLLAWYRYQTDCVNISISDVVITSLSQKKIRQQEFLISYEDFENQNLVKSSIGNGKILSVEKTRGTNQIKLTLKHGI